MQTVLWLKRAGVGVGPDRTVEHAARVMDQSGIGTVAVVDEGQVVGIVTDRDIVRRTVAARQPTDARIDSIMSTPAITIAADADMTEAYAKFRHHAVRRLVVIDGTRFVGMLSLDDLLVDAAANLTDLTSPLAAEIDSPHRDRGSLIESTPE